MGRRFTRTASTFITFFGFLTNIVLTVQVAAAWRSFTSKGEQESEWEALGDKWHTNGLNFVWGLFFFYFALSAIVSAVGLYGVLKGKACHVRFYRDYSIADFAFCSVAAGVAAYAAFLRPARVGICEELSHHPDLMRDMLEMGLNLENCELWLESAVFGIVAVLFVIIVVRLHFLLAVSNYYSQLIRHQSHHFYPYLPHHSHSHSHSHPFRRILLVPNFSHNHVDSNVLNDPGHVRDVEMVYAPVPRDSLPKELQEQATEAWVSTTLSNHCQHGHHRHPIHHHHCSSSKDRTGRIRLNISPGEGLLPSYPQSTVT